MPLNKETKEPTQKSKEKTIWQNVQLKIKNKIYDSFLNGDIRIGWSTHAVIGTMLDNYIVQSDFKLQLHYSIHVRINTLKKSLNLLILPAIG